MGPLAGRFFAWLMRPRVRRVRRWSFVATLPIGLLVGHLAGAEAGVTLVAARLALWLPVVVVAWRLGGERGEALRDLLMHPRARAIARAEFDIVTAVPRLLLARRVAAAAAGSTYARGTFGVALALAFTPMVLAEALVMHLLLGGGTVAWVVSALHAYMLVWLWGIALGPRAYPHRIGPRAAVLRSGPMYRVHVPHAAIVGAVVRHERLPGEHGLVVRKDGAVLLPVRDRVDVDIELSEPVRVQRPFREPLLTTRLGIASDDPVGFVEHLRAAATATPVACGRHRHGAATAAPFGALDLAGLGRDVLQPG